MTDPLERAEKAVELELQDFPLAAAIDEERVVRAALAAVRDPTPAMIAAGSRKVRGGTASDCAAATWRAMWDEMMAGGKESG